MKILMIAPEPFFEPRGTPFSEYFRIKALSHLGHDIDLVTYPIGEDKEIKNLKIYRSFRPFFIKSVKTGPSFNKLILDFFLFFKVIPRLMKNKYDLIHTHEEANIMGVFFSKIMRIPHLYDMHSSLVQQMDNFQFTKSKFIKWIFKKIENTTLKNAKSIIVICKSLFDHAKKLTDEGKLTIIENFYDEIDYNNLDENKLNKIKNEMNPDNKKLIVYTGTLEHYQGIPLLIDSMEYLDDDFLLVLIGGKEEQVERLKKEVLERGLEDKVKLLGTKSYEVMPYYLRIADVLVSPRSKGTNIPLKIYSYLKSGKPVVATNLYTHTQSIDNKIAILVNPEPKDFAGGIKKAVSDEGIIISENALRFSNKNYSFENYLRLVDIAIKKAIN